MGSRQLCHGQTVALDGVAAGSYRVYLADRFLGLGRVDDASVLSSQRLVVTN
ncbi:tRNA pseudouridine(55) synthase TruB [Denitromonas sp.]|uniref:tRNA pseudouridine(55) synthase TruB n=1 Tax=Denitromonas sp. TaxID=2734609 RepID=UPI002AFE6A38|nr:tRNA pseudouridine(55) synthase TruB [Denitromonas sp.]